MDDRIARRLVAVPRLEPTNTEAEIAFNLFYVALTGRPIDPAAAAPRESVDMPAELTVKAVTIPTAAPAAIVRPYPHPGDQIWRLSHSTVIEPYYDRE